MRRGPIRESLTRPLPPISATEVASVSDRIDGIAAAVRRLPDQPLTVGQRERLRIVSRELDRRADA